MPDDTAPERTSNERNAEFLRAFIASEHRIRSYIRALVVDRVAAEDVFQDVSVTLLEKYEALEAGADFTGWACRVAWYKVLEWRQRQARDKLRFSDATLQQVSDEALSAAPSRDARQEALENCLKRVSPDNLQMLILRYQDSETVDTIAAKVGRTEEAVYKALSRTRHFLHDCINRALAAEEVAR